MALQHASTHPVIVAELVIPGFTEDLSTWKFSVDADGSAVQEVRMSTVKNMFRDEPRTLTTKLRTSEVEALINLAKEGGFPQFESEYDADVTDLPTTALSFLIDGRMKRVEAFGAAWLAYEGSGEMKVFMDLWNRIERRLPYRGK